jgi:flagellar hook assembly protein FlgD
LNRQIEAGYHRLAWDGQNDEGSQAGAGVYFYLLESGQFRQTRKMTLVK